MAIDYSLYKSKVTGTSLDPAGWEHTVYDEDGTTPVGTWVQLYTDIENTAALVETNVQLVVNIAKGATVLTGDFYAGKSYIDKFTPSDKAVKDGWNTFRTAINNYIKTHQAGTHSWQQFINGVPDSNELKEGAVWLWNRLVSTVEDLTSTSDMSDADVFAYLYALTDAERAKI